ncbi:inositol-tetrakisphosphate 1-kinase isoform X2 [Oenanthe melanoleuca]|uniref:inositol-tetrakisphosphate 1-kinase isoform X2 n=1 Tax=Oenanthe melanoleuca TaxID=2939378 RepID=UPI0024C1C3D9|nr:inositol-tetrakisphosphate 1-kinase isoform X2 [Oenanthe melanoleuca]XP_056349505.1 inositol-tetrakisphosphate 1-kinase isoform X2 [Oenanthe melanoleuca]XP_056349507.1 inositol-tetrakisphosphate 1-kinase isoform X2 [Oenanthe melanoleuca]
MQTFLKGKRVGYWLSEKKIRKLNFQAFAELCRKRGVEVVQLDLSKPIEDQGPLDVIIHKLTDIILEADQNDSQSLELVHRFQEYIDAHPETIILDPLPAIRTLLDRSKSYELIRQIEAYMQDERICSPPFMELTSACGEDTLQLIEKNGLAFPFICKTRVAHGTNSHEMAIIFNQEGLKAVRPPCVIQSFINHNAVLYKVFVVGESYTVVKRPSLKNFSAGISDRESIFFNSHNVSKPESSSVLTAAEVCLVPRTSMTVSHSGFPYRAPLDKIEGVFERPNDDVIREISKALRQALGVSLFGIDIIINNQTGQHAVIDINAFPGYEGVSEFFTDLLNHIAAVLQGQVPEVTQLNRSKLLAEQSAGIMDERICCASTGCLSVMGKDSSWIVESETNSSVKLQHQRLGCNSAVSPSFQQHCVATLATKASSQ